MSWLRKLPPKHCLDCRVTLDAEAIVQLSVEIPGAGWLTVLLCDDCLITRGQADLSWVLENR